MKRDDRVPDATWLTKAEVAAKLGKGLASVTRLAAKGLLNPISIPSEDGGPPRNAYDPQEVSEILADGKLMAQANLSVESAKEDLALYQMDTVKAIVGLVREPREKIDEIQFAIIDGLRKRVDELEKQVEAGRKAREEALDQSAERNAAMTMLKNDQDIKKIATIRVMDTIGKLISGPDGVKLTPDQLEALVTMSEDGEEPFLSPEQTKEAKAQIAKSKASTNGKQTVQAVAKTVVDAAGVASHD